jgi:predicted dehydrogenase
MIDLGAHGMYLTHWVLGLPESAKSVFTIACQNEGYELKNVDGLEDNAVTVMTYDNGAIAINETGFVSRGCPTTLEVGGVDGYIYQDGGKYVLRNRDGVKELEILEDFPKPIVFFMKGETPDGCGLDEATALTRMMVGAYGGV